MRARGEFGKLPERARGEFGKLPERARGEFEEDLVCSRSCARFARDGRAARCGGWRRGSRSGLYAVGRRWLRRTGGARAQPLLRCFFKKIGFGFSASFENIEKKRLRRVWGNEDAFFRS